MTFNQTWEALITVNANCVTKTHIQKVKGQEHEGEDRCGGLTEASFFNDQLSWVAFLV